MPTIELLQFRFSHFNEKARWALDFKGVPHTRRSLLPGPHVPVVSRLTGKTELPVLRVDGEVIGGSAAIVDTLERRYPDRPLYPARPEWQMEALEIQRWFDAEVGPGGRAAMFLDLLPEGRYAARCFTQGFAGFGPAMYRAIFPMIRVVMRQKMRLGEAAREPGLAALRKGLDFVAAKAGPRGFLVGDRFSVADLTAASLLALVCFPPELRPGLPQPVVPAMAGWLARWADHPGTAWVQAMFREHRPPSAELAA
jgi:glutathione S-transferase